MIFCASIFFKTLIPVLRNVKTNTTIAWEGNSGTASVVDYGALWRYETARSQVLETSGPLQSEYDVYVSISNYQEQYYIDIPPADNL